MASDGTYNVAEPESERDEDGRYGEYYEDEDNGWWDEGLITALIVVGAVLFLIPEPATSGIGMLLMLIGVLGWLVDWAT